MLIKKIRLKNFKNFKDAELELGDMNVLVGANASGKSNFLQALKFLKDIQEHGLENAISLQGGMEYLRNINCGEDEAVEIEVEFYINTYKDIVISINDLKYNASIQNQLLNVKIKIQNKNLSEEISIRGIFFSDENIDVYDKGGNHTQTVLHADFVNKVFNKNGEIKYQIIGKDGIYFIDDFGKHEISFEDEQDLFSFDDKFYFFGLTKQLNKNQSLLELDIVVENIFDYSLFDFDLKKIKEPNSIKGKVTLEENGENIALVIKKILSDEKKARQFSNLISDILPFIKSIETEKFYDKSLLFKIQEKGHTSPIPSSLLSDGTVSVTAILIALFFENNRLTIIEEPEYGIHPSLVSKLVDTFYEAAKNKQIIITTHSSEILKHIKLEDLRLISRDENGFSTVSKPAEKEMVKEFLKNELGINDLFVQNLLDI